MFVFKSTMEEKVKELLKELEDCKRWRTEWNEEERRLKFEIEAFKKMQLLEVDKACLEVSKQNQQHLIESDLKRVQALAKLEAYEKMDTKSERQAIQKMLEKAIEGLSKQTTQIIK